MDDRVGLLVRYGGEFVDGLVSRASGSFIETEDGRRVLDFTAGPGPRTLDLPGLPAFEPLVCYEAIFPDEILGHAHRPDWLLNMIGRQESSTIDVQAEGRPLSLWQKQRLGQGDVPAP